MNAKEAYAAKPWLKHYPEGVTDTVDIPAISVPDLFDQVAEKYGNKTALIFYGKKISYAKLKELIDRFAAALADLGVKKGDTVALYLLNCPQYVIAYFAALKIGAKITPISPVYTSHEIKHQIQDSDATTVVCQDILYDNVEKTGIAMKNVILTSIADYLPNTQKAFREGGPGKGLFGNEGSYPHAQGTGWSPSISGPHKEIPASASQSNDRPGEGHRSPSLHGGHHRASQGSYPHPRQYGGLTGASEDILAFLRRRQRIGHGLFAFFPHLWPGRRDALKSCSGLHNGPLHHT